MKLARHSDGPEIFASIQGEGASAGMPSVFVRLSLCNLHCVWCDTDYTWNWEGTPYSHVNDARPGYRKYRRADEIIELPAETVAARVLAHPPRNIIFTGGEPLIQGKELATLAGLLKDRDPACRFEIETNGTLIPPETFDTHINQYNVSPKLANSANSQAEREKTKALAFFRDSGRAWFKFVVSSTADMEDIQALIIRHQLPDDRIILMPEGTTSEALRAKTAWLEPLCAEHGYRFGDRLHVHQFGNQRSV